MITELTNTPQQSGSDEASFLPFVSIVMPIRNEAAYIEQGLQQILDQDYPADKMEIVVADGMSDDGTRDIIARIESRHPRVRVVDNPALIPAAGLNAAIEQSRGEIVIRVDGHVEVANDFVSQSVALLGEHPEAWCVGGPIVHVGTSRFGRAVAAAMSHPFGVGNAKHRFVDYEGYGEGAAFPAIRRRVFALVGTFDEDLVRNQDDEWNYRVHQAGGRIYISPRVRYRYFVRDRIGRLFRQYFQYGFWRIPVMRKHRRATTARQLVPASFFFAVAVLLSLGLWLQQPIMAIALPAVYVTALMVISLSMVPRLGITIAFLVPVAMVTMHAAYALGMSYGLGALLMSRRAWSREGHMARISR